MQPRQGVDRGVVIMSVDVDERTLEQGGMVEREAALRAWASARLGPNVAWGGRRIPS